MNRETIVFELLKRKLDASPFNNPDEDSLRKWVREAKIASEIIMSELEKSTTEKEIAYDRELEQAGNAQNLRFEENRNSNRSSR